MKPFPEKMTLDQQIREISTCCGLTPSRMRERDAIVSALTNVATRKWSHATLALYGSSATPLGICTSDVDIVLNPGVLLPSDCVLPQFLECIRKACPWAEKTCKIVHTSAVPVLKFSWHTGTSVDITAFTPRQTGPQMRDHVLSLCDTTPQLEPLVKVHHSRGVYPCLHWPSHWGSLLNTSSLVNSTP